MTIDIEKIKQAALDASSGYHVIERLAAHTNLQNMLDPSAVLELITRLEAAEQDAARYQHLQNMDRKQAQSFFWTYSSRKQRTEAIDKHMKESK